jgi:hypothetical protein
LGTFLGLWNRKYWNIFVAIWNILQQLGIFLSAHWYMFGHLVYFAVIWYIFPLLVRFTKKNLATLARRRQIALISFGTCVN